MSSNFDLYEFENLLQDEFFDVYEKPEIGKLITKRLSEDQQFNDDYECWLDETGFSSWKDFYQELNDEFEKGRIIMSTGDEDDE